MTLQFSQKMQFEWVDFVTNLNTTEMLTHGITILNTTIMGIIKDIQRHCLDIVSLPQQNFL